MRIGRVLARGVLAAALLVTAAWSGWWLAGVLSSAPVPVKAPQLVTLGPVRVQVSGEWEPVRRGPFPLPALEGTGARAFAPYPGLAGRAVIALAPAGDASLVPAPLLKALADRPADPQPTRLADRPAWVYRSLSTGERDRLLDVYVVPTTAGALGVACVATRASWSTATDCAPGVESVTMRTGEVLAPSADVAFLQRLPGTLARLDRSRVGGRAALRRSRTRRGQATAARALVDAHRLAARRLAPVAVAGRGSAAVVGALDRTARAYRGLAGAAAHGWPRRYAIARATVRRAETRLERALSRSGARAS